MAAEARHPVVGDCVRESCNIGAGPSVSYEGNVTAIEDGLICLNCTQTVAMDGPGEEAKS